MPQIHFPPLPSAAISPSQLLPELCSASLCSQWGNGGALTRWVVPLPAGWYPYLLGGAGDNSLLEAVGLLLQVFSSLVIPEQIIFYLEMEHTYLSRTPFRYSGNEVIREGVNEPGSPASSLSTHPIQAQAELWHWSLSEVLLAGKWAFR